MKATYMLYHCCAKRFTQKGWHLAMLFCFFSFKILAQVPEMPAVSTEQQLENSTEANGDAEVEDDSFLQQMQQYTRHPINLNRASQTELKELRLLNALQTDQLISYRKLLGKFIAIQELQAIPSWDIDLINKIKPFVTITEKPDLLPTVKSRLTGGEHTILARLTQIIERSKGYLADTMANFYPGSPQKLLIRYKYQFKNLLQYGILGEKDAGEQFFRGRQKQGFDFYSAHLFARNIGKIKSVALGDFTVNMGQGLIQWQSLAFRKSSEVINVKRESAVIRPYNGAGEFNFHRGAGITLATGNFEITGFASCKKIDGNFVPDTSSSQGGHITSFQTSGYHRTVAETADKAIQQQLAFGANISYNLKRLHTGINAIRYKFKIPVEKAGDLYDIYALSGSSFSNFSVDYSYTYKNVHFFGEMAATSRLDKAYLAGMLISTAAAVDMSFLYRNISKSYQSFYSAAFTENSLPGNESGFYSGLSIHPGSIWRLDAYADFFKFPWLKFRVDAPSAGTDYLLQLTIKPGKQLEIYSRFRSESKSVNRNSLLLTLSQQFAPPRQSWRTQFVYKLNPVLSLRARVELLWFDKKSSQEEQGFLTYTEAFYKPALKKWSCNFRMQFFETGSYNSRMYAYENDVLYAFGIPVFYDKGLRYYMNVNYDVNKKLGLWLKCAQTAYNNRSLIGSGLDEIAGKKRTEIKIQMQYQF